MIQKMNTLVNQIPMYPAILVYFLLFLPAFSHLLVALSQQKENFCLPKVLFLFIQAAGLAYHQGRLAALVSHHAPACIVLALFCAIIVFIPFFIVCLTHDVLSYDLIIAFIPFLFAFVCVLISTLPIIRFRKNDYVARISVRHNLLGYQCKSS